MDLIFVRIEPPPSWMHDGSQGDAPASGVGPPMSIPPPTRRRVRGGASGAGPAYAEGPCGDGVRSRNGARRRPGSAIQRAIDLADAMRDALQERQRQLRLVLDELEDRASEETERGDRRLGHHARGPWATVEHRDLAEEVPRYEPRPQLPVPHHLRLTLEQDEERLAGIALLHDRLARTEPDLVGLGRQALEVA